MLNYIPRILNTLMIPHTSQRRAMVYAHIMQSILHSYFTKPHKDCLTILKILMNDSDLQFEFNEVDTFLTLV